MTPQQAFTEWAADPVNADYMGTSEFAERCNRLGEIVEDGGHITVENAAMLVGMPVEPFRWFFSVWTVLATFQDEGRPN